MAKKTVKTKLEIKSWDEKPYLELTDGRKFTKATVVLAGTEDRLQVDATWEAIMYYAADGTSTYVGLMHVVGTLDGHTGSFVQQGSGTYDGTQAQVDSVVVQGSGTAELAGLSGRSKSVSTHDDYPNWPMTLTYEIG